MRAARREITWAEFDEVMHRLAVEVSARGAPDAVVGIARGGAIVGCTLSFLLGRDFYPMQLRKRGGATRVVVSPPADVAGLHVALVDDFSLAGDTFRIAQLELSRVGARQVTTVALLRREPGFRPDVFGLEVANKVRFPWARDQLIEGQFVKR